MPEHGDTMANPPKDMGGIGNRLVESWDGRDYERHSSALRAPNMAARHPDINFRGIAAKIIRPRLWGFPEQAGRAGAAGPVAGRRVRQSVRAPWAGRGSARGTAPRPGGRPAPPRADPEQARPTPSPQTGCRRGPAARGGPPGAGGKARLKRQMNSKDCELT